LLLHENHEFHNCSNQRKKALNDDELPPPPDEELLEFEELEEFDEELLEEFDEIEMKERWRSLSPSTCCTPRTFPS
jgi:hypothetical protein